MVRIRFDISMEIRFCSQMNILIGPMTPPVHGQQGSAALRRKADRGNQRR
jgi:hypothetical protein